jgi:hypothetical protein
MNHSRLAAAALAATLPFASIAFDHADGPAVLSDPASDLTDLYAWLSPDGGRVQLVLAVHPDAGAVAAGARFSTTTRYVFHAESAATIGAAGTRTDLICAFDASTPQRVSCWLGGEYLTGDASPTTGIQSASGRLKVFAGLRADPAAFNAAGFSQMSSAISAAAGSLTFDAAGCPVLSASTSAALAGLLSHDAGGPATSAFGSANVLALVASVDRSLLSAGGPVLSIWASTNKAP